ncbi:MAG: glycosyltransferase family 4 protein [Acidimicrobiales bacterium]
MLRPDQRSVPASNQRNRTVTRGSSRLLERRGPHESHLVTRPLRIAHVSDFYLPRVGGIELHISTLSRAQRQIGHHVDVISSGGLVERDGWPFTSIGARRGATFESFSAHAIGAAKRAAIEGGYHVVHVHAGLATPLSVAVAAATSSAGLPTVLTMHSMVGALAGLYRGLDHFTGWRSWPVLWTSVSRVAARQFQTVLGDAASVFVLPNAVDVDAWRQVEPLRHKGIVIAAVMRLAPRKRPLALMRILRAVRRATPDSIPVTAIVIGEGAQRPAVERYLARHRMGSWISIPGAASQLEIRDLFRGADIFVAPAMKESFGIAALEARAAGVPVIAMAQSGTNEFIDDGRSGLLVNNDAEMVSAIAMLIADDDARARIATYNRSVSPQFGWSQALHRTAEMYKRAADLQRGGAPSPETPAALPTARLDVVEVHRSVGLSA